MWYERQGQHVERDGRNIPSLYLPVSIPLERAEKTVVPYLYFLYKGLHNVEKCVSVIIRLEPRNVRHNTHAYSTSKRSRWKQLRKTTVLISKDGLGALGSLLTCIDTDPQWER